MIPIVIENLKSVNVKDSDDSAAVLGLRFLGNFNRLVNEPDNPTERSIINSLSANRNKSEAETDFNNVKLQIIEMR